MQSHLSVMMRIGTIKNSTQVLTRDLKPSKSSVIRSFATAQESDAFKEPMEGIDWDKLGFSLTPTEFMYVSTTKKGDTFQKGKIQPYGPLQLYPSSTILNYGQGIFEGIKAFRSAKNRSVVFRPDMNSNRLNQGAERFLMPTVPQEIFMDGIDSVVKANSKFIPPTGRGALYLRPILFGSGAQLGVAPSSEYTFCVFASPVGNYFKGGLTTIDLFVTDAHRASPRGSGYVKAAGNYAPAFFAQKKAKEEGYAEVLFLDAKNDKYIEEAGASNVFILDKNGVLRTPELGSILPGVTRNSIITLAKEKGLQVQESKVSIDEVLTAKEAFCTGTGASLSPIGSVTYKGQKAVFNNNQVGPLTKDLFKTITDIQFERIPDTHGWIHYPGGKP